MIASCTWFTPVNNNPLSNNGFTADASSIFNIPFRSRMFSRLFKGILAVKIFFLSKKILTPLDFNSSIFTWLLVLIKAST